RARRVVRRISMSVAAVIVMGLLGMYAYYRPLITFPDRPDSYRLGDGSVVQLNGGSIAAPRFTGSTRHVTLWRGEAFFDVEHDLIRPFTVSAGKALVRAVGTTFDVRLLPSSVTVTVKEGRVQLEKHCDSDPDKANLTKSSDATVTLEAGEQATVSRDGCI